MQIVIEAVFGAFIGNDTVKRALTHQDSDRQWHITNSW